MRYANTIELITYYTWKYPDRLKTSEDYQIVGKMTIKAYPCLERFGVHPWVSVILICKHCISFSSINAIFKYTKSIYS